MHRPSNRRGLGSAEPLVARRLSRLQLLYILRVQRVQRAEGVFPARSRVPARIGPSLLRQELGDALTCPCSSEQWRWQRGGQPTAK